MRRSPMRISPVLLALAPLLLRDATSLSVAPPRTRSRLRLRLAPLRSSPSSPDPAASSAPLRSSLVAARDALASSVAAVRPGSPPVSWSNRAGAVLTPVALSPSGAVSVYAADRPFMWNGIDVGGRMTLVRLSDGSWFVHSPLGLDRRLRAAVDLLDGPVGHVVSPNYEHVKYAREWAAAYPEAKMWGCPGLGERMPGVYHREIPYGIGPPGVDRSDAVPADLWDRADVVPLHIDCEVNPFTKRPFFNEVVFYHAESETLLTTDSFWNYPRDGGPNVEFRDVAGREGDYGTWELAPDVGKIPRGSALWKFGMDVIFRPFYVRLMLGNRRGGRGGEQRERFRELAEQMVYGWDVRTVVPCHGDIIRGKRMVRNILATHFDVEKKQ